MNTCDLSQDVHFFAAALSQTLISVWDEDPAGEYVEVERGISIGTRPIMYASVTMRPAPGHITRGILRRLNGYRQKAPPA